MRDVSAGISFIEGGLVEKLLTKYQRLLIISLRQNNEWLPGVL